MMIFFLGFLGLVFCGVVVLYCSVLECRSVVCEFDDRFVLVEFTLCGSVFRVASIYAPNRNHDCDTFFVRSIDSIDHAIPTLLCSDFNTGLDRVLDRRGSRPLVVSREKSALLSAMFLDCCVVAPSTRHITDSAFTRFWPDGALASRIDLISCPYAWVPDVSSVDILLCPFSDHCALSFSWALPDFVPPGLGLWKLNRSVLDEA